ncbi:piggyBac transposable element-derived protein 1-like, partial [Sitodiplosis mosellana]|uniref:piggyBac transposable element-derived protein 1-like n=1 Tax=Sitodiplosis mosellana TaxID=263140 RepID=UPI002444E0BF
MFEQMRRFIHFADSSKMPQRGANDYDVLYKIRPLIKHFNERFATIPKEQEMSVDEQMCRTKMKASNIRQYMPKKPHKWGFKLFALCDSNGFCHAFEVYTGAKDNVVLENAPDLGAASNVVVRLTQGVPDFVNQIINCDNFFMKPALVIYLRSRGIHSLGTVRCNRIPNCKLPNDEAMKRKERGYSEEYVANILGCTISSVVWNDTKAVRLLSSYVGVLPFKDEFDRRRKLNKVSRWDKLSKTRKEIDCPRLITAYNAHMGGVDLMDGLIGRYFIRMRTKKWTNRLFHHLIDVALVNSHFLYQRVIRESKIELPDFRSQVAEVMCGMGKGAPKRPGRPSTKEEPIPKKTQKRAYLPADEVRFDEVGHWCRFLDRDGKKTCKFPGCKSETQEEIIQIVQEAVQNAVQNMVQEAVQEAMAPLLKRIVAIENHLGIGDT